MIKLDLTAVVETLALANAKQRLDRATGDTEGRAEVARRQDAPWRTLRPQLTSAQNGKCAYCEDYLRERMIEIDHVRPKRPSDYWWLAFSLPNLLAACRSCNNAKSHKWELSPGTTKLVARQEPWLVDEPSMFVDPSVDDPAEHLTYVYRGGRWRIAALSGRGLWTIAALELDRDSFTEEANEFIAQVVDPQAREIQAAKDAFDGPRLAVALVALSELDRDGQRWLGLVRVVTDAIVIGSYAAPV